MEGFGSSEENMHIDASKLVLILDFPDHCPKATDVMLKFLSCFADADLVSHLLSMKFIGTIEGKLFIDARKFGEFRRHVISCYPDRIPHLLFRGFRGINLSDWPENYKEEQRKHNQAMYARRVKVIHKRRLLGAQLRNAGSSDKQSGTTFVWRKRRQFGFNHAPDPAPLELQMEEEHRVIRLTDVTILPKVRGQGGETIVGTLEAHGNGFVYLASSFRMQFYFNNIKKAFFRLGDKGMPPLLHFHLYDPIMMGTDKAKDIQFHLVHCPLGQNKSEHDSDEIEKEKQIRDGGQNDDLKNFVKKVRDRWNSQLQLLWFEELDKEYEFYGVLPSKASVGFALASFSLILLTKTPFAVPFRDIEIINLALLRPGEIDMTVIFQDFKEDNLLEINSIPLKSLPEMKNRLNWGHVKYYVNAEKPDWKSTVKGIADFPEKFIENGGWDYFKLEDSDTLAYYEETVFDFDPEKAMEEG